MKSLPNLLIVDDTTENLILLKAITSQIEVNLIQSLSGSEALEKTRGIELALAIIDVRMPEMNGYEATRHIRQFNKDLVIVAQTAFALRGDREKAMEAGCNDYISKPIRKDKLMEVMQKH